MQKSAAVDLLAKMIATPSLSRQEEATAELIFNYLADCGVKPKRFRNNVYALSAGYNSTRPTVMLNSHHDTVKAAASYTRNPFEPTIEDGCIYGLGSNDAGASVVALIHTFLDLQKNNLPFNLLLAITAEEEVGGENGIRAFLPHIKEQGIDINCAIVGEPTEMEAAVAERGLLVFDCVTPGVTGHAARGEGVNAIYRAICDINTLTSFRFPKTSQILGPISLNVTQINAGRQHNVIPDECTWVVDVRTTDAYTNEETVQLLKQQVSYSTITPRSTRVRASVIDDAHPLVQAAVKLGRKTFVSPTTSDMSLMYDFPTLKIGPGKSARSHAADEYVRIDEIDFAISLYKRLIESINLSF